MYVFVMVDMQTLLQESAMRGASERYASLSETASNHLKAQQSNAEAASTALAELTAARTAAKDTHKKLSALSANMNKALRNFEGAHICQRSRAVHPAC